MNNLHDLAKLADEIVVWCSICSAEPATGEVDTVEGWLPIGEKCTQRLGVDTA